MEPQEVRGRGLGGATIALFAIACSASNPGLKRPEFGPPRDGVWNTPRPIVEGTDDEMMPVIGRGGWLVYTAQSNGNVDLYRRPSAGGAARRLTEHPGEDTDPSISPDGKRIVFTSQSADVKGDIWVMDIDGTGKKPLTDRLTADSAPCWAPSGESIYFTSSVLGGRERIERVTLDGRARTIIVEGAWDPAISPDGEILFYAALDQENQTRLFARRLSDGRASPLTDGAYPEGLPRAVVRNDSYDVFFVRFADDTNRDGRLDSQDPGSLWRARFDPELFEGAAPGAASPLTSGSGSELFPASIDDWFLYTTAGYDDLEIYALPEEGIVAASAQAESVLQAAQSEDDASLRRLGLRYVIANDSTLEGSARYELARDLAERDAWSSARAEFRRASAAFGDDPMAVVSTIEVHRMEMLEALKGELWAKERRQQRSVENALQALENPRFASEDLRIQTRLATTRAEASIARGQIIQGITTLEGLIERVELPAEDRARALDRLADAYGRLNDRETLARLCERLLRDLSEQRYYARQCAQRWVASAHDPVGVPAVARRGSDSNALGVSVLAELERLAFEFTDIPTLAARARTELAIAQSANGHEVAAREAWTEIIEDYPNERDVLASALISLGEVAEREGELDLALDSYENLLARYPEDPALRSRARRGISRIALRRARKEESEGRLDEAIADYRRIIENDPDLAEAHRRYIRLSVQRGRLPDVVEEYRESASENPLSRLARYGLGYALTFGEEPDIGAAEKEILAALDLDPRLAPAHLTLGWIRLQRERQRPRGGWAEKAVESFTVAEELLDRNGDDRLYAATRLNVGNALFMLGKLDDAFIAYLDRELSRVSFDDPLTALIFRERFARTALREDHLDVAVDQAKLAYRLAGELPGEPRRATLAALIGSVYFLAEDDRRAVAWLQRAEHSFRAAEDWSRTIPILRTLSLAERRLGEFDAAVEHIAELERLLENGRGPEDPSRPFFNGYEFLIWSETPAKADDVTLGPYGFTEAVEDQIAKSLRARTLAERGQLESAKKYMRARIQLLRRFVDDGTGGRATPEWIVALNEAAVLMVRSGDYDEAQSYWFEAIAAADASQAWTAVAVMSESLLTLWLDRPETIDPSRFDELRRTLKRGVEEAEEADVARVSALFELRRYDEGRRELSSRSALGSENRPETRFRARLNALGKTARSANAIQALTARFDLEGIDTQLPATTFAVPVGEEFLSSTDDEVTTASDTDSDASGGAEAEADSDPDSGAEGGPPADADSEAEGADDDALDPDDVPLDSGPSVIAVEVDRRTNPWRVRYNESLSLALDGKERDELLRQAGDLFLADPTPSTAPEVSRFLTEVEAQAVATGDLERAWRILEHQRLLALQPSEERRNRGGYPEPWLELIRARGSETYAPGERSAVIRALEGVPTELSALAEPLKDRATLLQLFRVGERWVWYATDGTRLDRFEAKATERPSLPAEVRDWLVASEGRTVLYVDGGGYLDSSPGDLMAGDVELDDGYEIAEVLSATYLVAAYEARNLARSEPMRLGADGTEPDTNEWLATTKSVDGAGFVRFAVESELYGSRLRPGASQVVLRNTTGNTWLDLDRLVRLSLTNQFWVFDRVPSSSRAMRLLAQSALISGTPSVVVQTEPFDLESSFNKATQSEPLLLALREADRSKIRVFGYAGMKLEDRVGFANQQLLASVGRAAKSYARAKKSKSAVDWRAARDAYRTLLGYVDYLLVPAHNSILAASPDPATAKRAGDLDRYSTLFREQYAAILIALGDTERVVDLRRQLAASYEARGEKPQVLKQLRELGIALAEGRRTEEAREAYLSCIDLAIETEKPVTEADCRSRLGSVYRDLYDYDEARSQYERSIALYVEAEYPDQGGPALYLGYLYENAFNDYDAALKSYKFALAAAQRFADASDQVPLLNLSIARIYRLRGEFERALSRVERARAAIPEDDRVGLADASIEEANIFWYRGTYRRARRAQRAALKLSLESGNTFQRIRALSVGGLIAMNEGDLEEAQELIESALELSRITKRRIEEANQLNNLGVVFQRADRLDAAVETFSEALAIDDELESREGRAFDLRNLGTALGLQGKNERALEALDEALTLSRELGIPFNEVQSLYRRGNVVLALGRRDDARVMYNAAADLAQRISVPEVRWRSLFALGRLDAEEGDREGARRNYRRALQVAERLGRSREANSAEASRDNLYEAAVAAAVDAKDFEDAFELMERRRGRARLDALANRTLSLADPEAQRLLRSTSRARDRVVAARRSLARGDDGAEEAAVESREARYRELQEELRRRFPRIARAFTLKPVDLAEFRTRLPPDLSVVTFLIGARDSFAMVITAEDVNITPLDINSGSLNQLATQIQQRMRAFAPLDTSLLEASTALIAPIEDRIAGSQQVVFVPDGALDAIPFAALPTSDGVVLDRWTTSEVTTASTLYDLLAEKPALVNRVASFAFGADLPFAELEARAVGDTPIIAADATPKALRENRADAWDLAVHTILDGDDPLSSSLSLAPSTDASGRLRAEEVFTFDYVAPVVSLSGCETALSAHANGSRLSLADTFFAAGAQSVIATRHRVADLAAARMMKWFYRFRADRSSAEALRQAMQVVRLQSAHPAHWASFTVVGDPR